MLFQSTAIRHYWLKILMVTVFSFLREAMLCSPPGLSGWEKKEDIVREMCVRAISQYNSFCSLLLILFAFLAHLLLASHIFTICFCLWCIKKAAGLALKSFFPILWSVHSWICSHVADNRWIASPALLSSSASGGSYSTCCALSLLSLDSAPSAAQLFQALE